LFSHIRTIDLHCGRAEQQSLSTRAHPGGVFPSPRRHTAKSQVTHNGESTNLGFARNPYADETSVWFRREAGTFAREFVRGAIQHDTELPCVPFCTTSIPSRPEAITSEQLVDSRGRTMGLIGTGCACSSRCVSGGLWPENFASIVC